MEYRFRAVLQGERALVETNLPVKALKIYAQSPITGAVLNGKALSVQKVSPAITVACAEKG